MKITPQIVFNPPDAPPGPPSTPPAPPPTPPAPPAPPARPNEPSALNTPPAPPAAPITGLPENWRELMAGTDADALKELQRFEPGKVGGALLNYKRQMRSGSFDTPPPPEDKPEELKAWREAHGIPVEESGYKVADDVSKRLVEEDKPVIANFIAAAHKANQPQAVVDFASKWYADMMDQQAAQQVKLDRESKSATEDVMRGEWGPDYTRNFAAAERFAKEVVPDANLFDARLPDGRRVGNAPEMLRALYALGVAKYGAAEVVGEAQLATAAGRMAEFERKTADGTITQAERAEWFKLIEADEARKASKR